MIMAYLKLVRFQNLLIIAFMQFAMSQMVLVPILQTFGFDIVVETTRLLLLIGSTVLIAAGGYVLNDYFDIKIDTINKPEKLIVGQVISRSVAMLLHQALTGMGVISGLILAYYGRSFTLAFIFLIVPGLLWFYSASYKRQFLTGNVIVAFVAALSVLVVAVAQLAFLQKEYGTLIFETPIPKQFYSWIGGFAFFSFLSTWIREIIKDMEDEKGDREVECRTMPIVWGIRKTKLFLYGLIAFMIIALYLANSFLIPFEGSLTFRYITFGIALPLIMLSYLIYNAKLPSDFHQAATVCKIVMLIGTLYCLLFYYLQAKTFGISLFNLFMVQ